MVTCEIKLFHNYFSLRQHLSEVILPEIVSKLFQRLIACSVSLK